MTLSQNNSGTRPPTLAQAFVPIEAEGKVPAKTLRRLRSDLNVAARCIAQSAPRADGSRHYQLANLPCDPAALRPLLMRVQPARFWNDKHRWLSIKSSVAKVLRLTGWMDCSRAQKLPEGCAWRSVVDKVAHPTQHALVQNFAHFCIARNVEPQGVTSDDVEAYRAHRDRRTLDCDIAETINVLRRAWNNMAKANENLALTNLAVRTRPGSYVLPDRELPSSLLTDIATYLARLAKPSPFDRVIGRPRAKTTIVCLEKIMKRAASVLLSSGFDKADVQEVADLVRPRAVEVVLTDQLKRLGKDNRWAPGTVTIAAYLKMIAKHTTQLSEEERKASLELCSCIKSPKSGMTRKNRDRIAVFDDPEIMDRWYDVPRVVFEVADQRFKEGKFVRAAQIHQAATALALLQCKPLRSKEAAMLDLQRHFRTDRRGRAVYFCIDAFEMKCGLDAEAFLTERLIHRLEIHLQKYRPFLDKHDCSFLFPGKFEGHMNPQSLANSIVRLVKDYLGVDYNIHLTRHLIATIILDASPENGPIAQRMLDHTSLKTTTTFYGAQRTRGAQAAYNRILEERSGMIKSTAKAKPKPRRLSPRKDPSSNQNDDQINAADSFAGQETRTPPEDGSEGQS